MVRSLRLAFSLCAIGVAFASSAAVALAQSTILVANSEPGDRIGGGIDRVITPQTKTFSLTRNYRGGVSVMVGSILDPDQWRMEFAPPKGEALGVGYYTGVLPHPWASMAAMSIAGPGGDCGNIGRFLVREITFGSGDEVMTFAVDAQLLCPGATAALFVALRYNSTVPTDLFPGSIGRFGLNITPSPDGVVTGGGIACGQGQTTCVATFNNPTTVTLTAVPRAGYLFAGWAGACSGPATTSVNVNMVRDCRATFTPAVPSSPQTLLTLRFAPGNQLLNTAGEEVYSAGNSWWDVSFWNNSVVVRVSGASGDGIAERSVQIAPPPGMVFGQWYDVAGVSTITGPELGLTAGGTSCSAMYGRFRVHEWRKSPLTGQFAFAADFEGRCGSPTDPLLTGSIRYQATFEMPTPTPPPPPPPACPLPDPFAGLGGGTCHNGGWLPPGMTPPSTPPLPPASIVVLQSEPGDYVGGGVDATFTPASVQTFTVQRNYRNGISVTIQGPNFTPSWRLEFAAPTGVALEPGYYPGALRYPFAPLTAMDISGEGRGCNSQTGRFLVRELVYDASGEVVRAAIDAEQHCADRNAGLFAAIRYNSSVPTDTFPGEPGKYGVRIPPSPYGIVTGDGISCGSTPDGCTVIFDTPTIVTLTATPKPGYVFSGWSGACGGPETTTVTVNTLRDCAPIFEAAVPTAPRTRLVTRVVGGGGFGTSEDELYSRKNGYWTAQLQGRGILVDIGGAGQSDRTAFQLRVIPPTGILNYGQWYDTTLSGANGTAGLYFSTTTLMCSSARQRVRIHEWRLDPTLTQVRSLAIDFERYCAADTTPTVTGTLHYEATFEIQTPCTGPDPFAAVGGGVCVNGGWQAPATPAPPPPSSGSGCAGTDPFTAIGGGVCQNGGWIPAGVAQPGGGQQPSTPPPAPPPPPTPPSSGGCPTADPFAAMGGGVCVNGGWLPPGMAPPVGAPPPTPSTPAPPAPPSTPAPPPAGSGTCQGADPFASIGGGVCFNGGWLPAAMVPALPMPPSTPATPPTPPPPAVPSGPTTCSTPDPFASLGGGRCVAGGWLPPGMGNPGGGGE